MAIHSHYHYFIFQDEQGGGLVAGAVHKLGNLRNYFKLFHLAIKYLTQPFLTIWAFEKLLLLPVNFHYNKKCSRRSI